MDTVALELHLLAGGVPRGWLTVLHGKEGLISNGAYLCVSRLPQVIDKPSCTRVVPDQKSARHIEGHVWIDLDGWYTREVVNAGIEHVVVAFDGELRPFTLPPEWLVRCG